MELFELSAKLKLDDSSFNKGIDNAMGAGERLKGQISAATVAVGNLAADMVRKGVSAISGVINGAIDGYANYQQLIGGVETLFGASANKVANYAKQSFKTTGLSANNYMETVTSFAASLTQGLGDDTEKAADLANVAVQDMADNANKMGTDIQMIQNAYQGFAKGNYTMLDNLKLGYGGTKGEMVRLINDSGILEEEIKDLDGITFDQLIEAIHEIQTEIGITGTTAKEASDTISGSKGSLKAAWEDMLSAVGGEGDQNRLDQTIENFKASFTGFMENYIPSVVKTIGNSGDLITAIADSISSLPTTLLSDVADSGLEAGTKSVKGVSKITNWLIDSISEMFKSASVDNSQVVDFGAAIGQFLGETLAKLGTNAPNIIFGMMNVGINLAGGLIDGLRQGLFGEGSEVKQIADDLANDISDVNVNYSKSSALIAYMSDLEDKYGSMVYEEERWKAAKEELEQALPGAGKVFEQYGSDIEGALKKLQEMNDEMRRTAIVSAMNQALDKEYGLLAEQKLALSQSEIRSEQAQAYVDTLPETVRNNLVAYAAEALEKNVGLNHLTFEQAQYFRNLSEGSLNGLSLDQYSLDDLVEQLGVVVGTLDTLYGAETPEEEKIWGRSETDQMYSLEQIQDFQTEYNKSLQIIESEAATQAELQKQINQTQTEIDRTMLAIQRSVEEDMATYTSKYTQAGNTIKEGGDTAGKAIVDGGSVLQSKLESIAANLPLFGGNYALKATGIDYVPTNGFRAELHRGEGVLTASENQRYRNGMGTSEVVGAIQEMRQDLQNLRLVVGTKTFGRAVVNYGGSRMDGYIGQAESRLASGYGA